jgi:glucuronoarabinoxylan endo-1,4-beta-xylanase
LDAAPGSDSAIPGSDASADLDSSIPGFDATTGLDSSTPALDATSGTPDAAQTPDAATAPDAGETQGTPAANAVIVDPSTVHQHISGFGASSAWVGNGYQNASDPTTFFSTTSGAGLSLFRVRIQPSPAGTTSASEIAMAKTAQSMGATVWATPWTPPTADKSNSNTVEGTLTNPSAWAASLKSYVTTMKAAGINLYAVSSQNEPDANVTYESCVYTGATLASFVGTYMGPALAGSGVKVMTPETQNWEGFATFEPALAANATAWAAADIVATHEYGGNPSAYPAIQAAGKEFWETEWYPTSSTDSTMTNGLVVANEIYQALTVANMNAWHYWWFYPTGSGDSQGLFDFASKTPAKRLWVLGNFSRFVRPGFNRIDVAGTKPPTGVSVIAFQSPTDDTVAIVAINTGGATTVPIFVKGTSWPASVVPWTTSSSDNLTSAAAIAVAGGNFSASLAAQSVTTFVGKP